MLFQDMFQELIQGLFQKMFLIADSITGFKPRFQNRFQKAIPKASFLVVSRAGWAASSGLSVSLLSRLNTDLLGESNAGLGKPSNL